MRFIGLDVHRDFSEVAIAEAGEVRLAGRVQTEPAALALFAQSLGGDDEVALEVTGNALEIARPERLKAPALLLTLDAIWRSLEGPLRQRCVLVDEAWLLMREAAGARFLFRLAKSARKRWCGLTSVTQDAGDLLGSDLGQSVVSNSATQVLLRQAPQAIERVGEAFKLSADERRYLLSCPTGSG